MFPKSRQFTALNDGLAREKGSLIHSCRLLNYSNLGLRIPRGVIPPAGLFHCAIGIDGNSSNHFCPSHSAPMWHSPPAIRHTRLRRPGIGSALHALHATTCYVLGLFRNFGKPGFRRKFLMNRWLWLFVSQRSGTVSFPPGGRIGRLIVELAWKPHPW